jgi:C-terminal processing protease CtpA/Prc
MSVVAEGKDYKTFRIREVLEGSAAARAGFAVNDVILSIDGKDVAGLTLSRINELFEKPITYKLVVKRGEETKSLPLTPRRLEELVSN